jgi:hypothetical protein
VESILNGGIPHFPLSVNGRSDVVKTDEVVYVVLTIALTLAAIPFMIICFPLGTTGGVVFALSWIDILMLWF